MMSKRWLLPDGVEEVLPEQASKVERLRRQILDLYKTWGYQFVIPPLLEFSESLLIGLGQDMQSQTLQFGDPMSARLLALRADITPQIARIDAHSLASSAGDAVNRLCYAGTVVRSHLAYSSCSRTPIFAGAELYGDQSIEADCEVILLMLETLKQAGLQNIHLDLGHIGIYRDLVEAAQLSDAVQDELFDAIQRKAQSEIDATLDEQNIDPDLRQCISKLCGLHGDISLLEHAKEVLAAAPKSTLSLLDDLSVIAQRVSARVDNDVIIYFDLSELSGYHYHSGLVFSALAPELSQALAKGGRYDRIGEVFGRARPATGFDIELKALAAHIDFAQDEAEPIYCLESSSSNAEEDTLSFWHAVRLLRTQHEIVICTRDEAAFNAAKRRLVNIAGQWQVQA